MSEQTKTPRTDALLDEARNYLRSHTSHGAYLAQLNILADHSRQLETELATVRAELEEALRSAATRKHLLDEIGKLWAGDDAETRRLTRELDVAMHGEEGAAPQASLCDLVSLARRMRAALAERNADGERLKDAAMMIGRLSRHLKLISPGSEMAERAAQFLARHQLLSPLRSDSAIDALRGEVKS